MNKLILENSIETTGLNLINYKQNVSDQRTYKNRSESLKVLIQYHNIYIFPIKITSEYDVLDDRYNFITDTNSFITFYLHAYIFRNWTDNVHSSLEGEIYPLRRR